MKLLLSSLLVAGFLAGGVAQATSWYEYAERCVTDAEGRYYVVVKRKDDSKPYGPVTLTIAERRAGSAPVRPAKADELPGAAPFAIADARIRVREGDIVHGRVDLDQPPGVILVSPSGKGIVTLDKYGFNDLGDKAGIDDLVIYSLAGKVLHRKNRNELFDTHAPDGFTRGDGYLVWLNSSWIDDKRGEVVIVGARTHGEGGRRSVLTVSLSSGNVRGAGHELIERAIAERIPLALSPALELARELKLSASKSAWPEILGDEKFDVYARLQAAMLLHSTGDGRGTEFFKKAALKQVANIDERSQCFAVRNLPEVLGDQSAPILCNFVRRFEQYSDLAAWQAMFKVSADSAVPELRRMLDRKESVRSNLFALECLGGKGPAAKAAVSDIVAVLEAENRVRPGESTRLSTHEYAARALGRIGPEAKAALPVLIRHAEKTAPAEWARVKDAQPKSQSDHFGGIQYSENRFIDAICKIRSKSAKK